MILKALGLMDFMAALTVVMLHYDIVGSRFGLVFASYMFVKGILFRGDLASIIDFLVGIYMVLLILGTQWGIATYIVAIYLMQKVVFSFISI